MVIQQWRQAVWGAVLIALAIVLGLFVRGEGTPTALDVWWQQAQIGLRTEPLIIVARAFDWIGGGWRAVVIVPVILVTTLILLRRYRATVATALALLLSVGIVQLLKSLFGRARPEDMLVASDIGSFPSGHTANAATVAVIVVLLTRRRWVVWVGALYVVLMALSRTYLGAHWVTDTIAGALIGIGAVLIAFALLPPQPLATARESGEDDEAATI